MVIGLVPVWQIEARAKESSETIPDATVAYNGHYYGLYDMGVYWRDAKVACEKLGGHLVTITSEEEQNALLGLLANTTRAVFWIGASKQNGTWSWITGENWSYTNWNIGEHEPSGDGNYVQMMAKEDGFHNITVGTWNDKYDIKFTGDFWGDVGYICEWDSLSDVPFSWINSAGANIPADQYGIFVVGSDGKPISGASVTWSYGKVIGSDFSETKQTDQTGVVLFPKYTVGEPLIEVSCDGYKSYTNKGTNYAKSDKGYDVIRLYKESESDLLLRYAKYKDSTDLLTGVKTLNLKNSGNLIGDLTSGDFTISCQAIDPDKVQSYQLWQNENKITDSADGSFSLNVDDGFAAGGGCLIRTIGADGTEVDTPINLTFTKNEYNKATGIKLGDEIKFTAKDNVPFLGGGTFSIGDLPLLPVEVEVTEDKFYIGFNAKIVGGSNDAEKRSALRTLRIVWQR